jgi:hypothetical protein
LNKKSAQKQKRLRNNGFSQAVVPPKTVSHQKDKTTKQIKNIKTALLAKGCFYMLLFNK